MIRVTIISLDTGTTKINTATNSCPYFMQIIDGKLIVVTEDKSEEMQANSDSLNQ